MMAMEPSNLYNQQQQERQQERKASQLFAQRALLQDERRLKPPDQVVACPRCQSLNTKFCYYNNYSLTQPRHFCKNCRRYWTAGGSLRNVPVGGGCRKKKPRANKHQGQISSGTANSETHELSAATTTTAAAAEQQQHTRLGSSYSSSSTARFFDSEAATGGTTAWSRPMGTILQEAAAGSDLDRFTQISSCQGPTSISPGLVEFSSQPFESGIMSLGLFNSVRRPEKEEEEAGRGGGLSTYPATSQQLVHGRDDNNNNHHLCSFFDNPDAYSTRLGGGASAALSEEAQGPHYSYNHTRAHGEEEDQALTCGRGGEIMWRNLQQTTKQEEVLWGGHEDESILRHGSLDLNRQQAKLGLKFST